MFTRAELQFKSRACVAQLKLRVVLFSMAIGLPVWIGWYVLLKLSITPANTIAGRMLGLILLVVYVVGVFRILKRTQRDYELVCPKCGRLLGAELGRVTKEGVCAGCGEKIVIEKPVY